MFLLCLSLGCGGSVTNPLFSGTIRGASFQPTSVAVGSGEINASNSLGLIVMTKGTDDICADTAAHQRHGNVAVFSVGLVDQDAAGNDSAPAAPGTYTILPSKSAGAGRWAVAFYEVTNAFCQDVESSDEAPKAVSGSVLLTKVDSTGWTGTFDLVLSTGDHVTGAFTSPLCPTIPGYGKGICK